MTMKEKSMTGGGTSYTDAENIPGEKVCRKVDATFPGGAYSVEDSQREDFAYGAYHSITGGGGGNLMGGSCSLI